MRMPFLGPQDLDGRPGPEGAFFFEGQVPPAAGGQVGDVDPACDRVPAQQLLAAGLDHLARCRGQRGVQPGPGRLALLVGSADQCGQDREAHAGPLVHGGFAVLALFGHRALAGPDRARHRVLGPPRRVLGGPLGDVEVERPDGQQLAADVRPVADSVPVAVGDLPEPFLPGGGDLGVQAQRGDARVMLLQVPPEIAAQRVGHAHQGRIVEFGGPLGQVGSEQLPHGLVLQAVLGNEPGRGELPGHPGGSHGRRGLGGQHAGLGQQRIKQGPVVGPLALVLLQRVAELHAVADGDVADQAALAEQDPGDPVERFLQVLGVAPAGHVEMGPEAGKPGRVDPAAGLFKEDAGTVAQQPAIAGTQDLAGEQQAHRRQQVVADMLGWPGGKGRDQARPGRPRGLGSAGQPAVLPGRAGLLFQPVQQRGEPSPHGPANLGAGWQERRRRQPLLEYGAALHGFRP